MSHTKLLVIGGVLLLAVVGYDLVYFRASLRTPGRDRRRRG